MLDYKELSINPHHLHKNSQGTFVDDIFDGVRNVLNIATGDWRMDDFLTWASGNTVSDQDIKDKEREMVKQLSNLSYRGDDVPVLTDLYKELGLEEEKLTGDLESLFATAGTKESEMMKKLYKMGVKKHGRISAVEDKLDVETKRGISNIQRGYAGTVGGIEDRAIGMLDEIQDAITAVPEEYKQGQSTNVYHEIAEGLFKPGGTYESKGKFDPYKVSTLGGRINPEEELDKAYQFDYTQGKPKRTTTV